jgi:hypothetical protein
MPAAWFNLQSCIHVKPSLKQRSSQAQHVKLRRDLLNWNQKLPSFREELPSFAQSMPAQTQTYLGLVFLSEVRPPLLFIGL